MTTTDPTPTRLAAATRLSLAVPTLTEQAVMDIYCTWTVRVFADDGVCAGIAVDSNKAAARRRAWHDAQEWLCGVVALAVQAQKPVVGEPS